jgi:hypothetical protein
MDRRFVFSNEQETHAFMEVTAAAVPVPISHKFLFLPTAVLAGKLVPRSAKDSRTYEALRSGFLNRGSAKCR